MTGLYDIHVSSLRCFKKSFETNPPQIGSFPHDPRSLGKKKTDIFQKLTDISYFDFQIWSKHTHG